MIVSNFQGIGRYRGVRPTSGYYTRRFNGLGDDASDNAAAADSAVSEIKSAYRIGAIKVNVNPDAAVNALIAMTPITGQVLLWAGALAPNSSEVAIVSNYAKLGEQIRKWSTTYLTWAKNGQRDDGTPYTWDLWKSFGTDIQGAIKEYTKDAWDSSSYLADLGAIKSTATAVVQVAADVANAAAKIADVGNWSLAAKIGVPLVGLGIGYLALRHFLR